MYPPYLFDRGDAPGACRTVLVDVDTATVELTVRGRWDRQLGIQTYRDVRKCLAEHPAALILDLHEVTDPFAASATMWLAANRAASVLSPPVRLAISVAPTGPLAGKLRRLGAARFLPLFGTMPEARAAVAGRLPLTEQLQLTLPPEPSSAIAARDLVGAACDAWRLPDLVLPGRLIISELVDNAVEHAGTELKVTVFRRGAGLHLSVHDGGTHLPHLRAPNPVPRGRGLRLVDAKSTAWGAMPTRDGKLVWATIRPTRPGPT